MTARVAQAKSEDGVSEVQRQLVCCTTPITKPVVPSGPYLGWWQFKRGRVMWGAEGFRIGGPERPKSGKPKQAMCILRHYYWCTPLQLPRTTLITLGERDSKVVHSSPGSANLVVSIRVTKSWEISSADVAWTFIICGLGLAR